MIRRSEERQSKFDKIRQRLAQESLDSGGYWKPKVGTNKIRLLPEVGEMEFFFVNVGQHFLTRTNRHFCPDFTLDLPCPICEFVSQLYTEGGDANIKLAENLRVRKQYWMNIIDRNAESAGPQIFSPGKMVFGQIKSLVMDPQYGDLLVDVDDGLDLRITRTGTGRTDTRYETHSDRETSPLSSNPAEIDQWLDAAMDLSSVELTDDPTEDHSLLHDDEGNVVAIVAVEPYERIKAAFEGIDRTVLSAKGDDDEEDDEEAEDRVASVIRSRRSRRGARR